MKYGLPILLLIFIFIVGGCIDENSGNQVHIRESRLSEPNKEENDLKSNALGCFRAFDAEVSDGPVPYFPFFSLQANNVEGWENTVVAPYEFTMYRYWTNEYLNSAKFKESAAFRSNPVWTSDTMDLAAIIPVFSDESRRLFYIDSGYIEEPVDLTILDEGNYYSTRESFLAKLTSEPEDGGGGPSASDDLSSACQPLLNAESQDLYPVAIESEDEADMEWSEGTYPYRNLISLFSGYQNEYSKLYDTYVLSYNTDHSEMMNVVVHLYRKNQKVARVWMEANGREWN